jgi:hypothetical protein
MVGDEVNGIHGRYIIWHTTSHFTQIVYRVAGGTGFADIFYVVCRLVLRFIHRD